MYFSSKSIDNKDTEILEKKSHEDYLVHEAILFLIDASISSNSDQEISIIVKTALTSAYEMVLQRVIFKPMISFGILLYGTENTNIPEFLLYPNLYYLMNLTVQSTESIKNFKELLLGKHSSYKLKRIFLITYNDDPSLGSEDYKNKTLISVSKLYDSNIIIEPFFVTGKKKFDFDKFYKNILHISENTDKIENHLTYEIFTIDQMLNMILKRQYYKRFLFECSLQIAPNLNIDVRGYMLFKKRMPIKTQNIYTKFKDPQIVKTTINYICQETSAFLKNEDMKIAYDFGGEKISFSKKQMDSLHFYEDPVIRILGFKPLDQLHFWENILPSYFLYPIDNRNHSSSRIFLSLAYTLYKHDKIAVAWFHPYKNSNPRISILISNFDLDEKQKRNYELPQGIFVIILPFSDDIRLNPQQTSVKAPELLINKMCDIIEHLILDTYNPLQYKSPGIQWTCKKLQSIIFKENSHISIEDNTTPNYRLIYEKSGLFIREWNELLTTLNEKFETTAQKLKRHRDDIDD
ncbi:hypothetical protein PMAC_003278 [Pneumocystis sp. 'macacae']|nr:hypothetical protein PMAC_003278 [Pneumocystis sp. 'macacae']